MRRACSLPRHLHVPEAYAALTCAQVTLHVAPLRACQALSAAGMLCCLGAHTMLLYVGLVKSSQWPEPGVVVGMWWPLQTCMRSS